MSLEEKMKLQFRGKFWDSDSMTWIPSLDEEARRIKFMSISELEKVKQERRKYNYEGALESLGKYGPEWQYCPRALNEAALCIAGLGEHDEAIPMYERSESKLKSLLAKVIASKVSSLIKTEAYEKALKCTYEAEEYDPMEPLVWVNRLSAISCAEWDDKLEQEIEKMKKTFPTWRQDKVIQKHFREDPELRRLRERHPEIIVEFEGKEVGDD